MVLEDGALGKQLGCEGGVSFHEISLLLQTDKRELVPRLCPLTVNIHQGSGHLHASKRPLSGWHPHLRPPGLQN